MHRFLCGKPGRILPAAAAIVLVIPGPTILTVISYSVAHGRRANAPLVAAVALGDSTALVLQVILGTGASPTSPAWTVSGHTPAAELVATGKFFIV